MERFLIDEWEPPRCFSFFVCIATLFLISPGECFSLTLPSSTKITSLQ